MRRRPSPLRRDALGHLDEKGAAQACPPRPRPVPFTPSPLRGGGECPRPPEHAAGVTPRRSAFRRRRKPTLNRTIRPQARDEKGAAQACPPRPRPVPLAPSPLRGGGECPRPPEHAAGVTPRRSAFRRRRKPTLNRTIPARRQADARRRRLARGARPAERRGRGVVLGGATADCHADLLGGAARLRRREAL